jgi:hypothetical protein
MMKPHKFFLTSLSSANKVNDGKDDLLSLQQSMNFTYLRDATAVSQHILREINAKKILEATHLQFCGKGRTSHGMALLWYRTFLSLGVLSKTRSM